MLLFCPVPRRTGQKVNLMSSSVPYPLISQTSRRFLSDIWLIFLATFCNRKRIEIFFSNGSLANSRRLLFFAKLILSTPCHIFSLLKLFNAVHFMIWSQQYKLNSFVRCCGTIGTGNKFSVFLFSGTIVKSFFN